MSDAISPRSADPAPDARHMELLELEVSRHRQNALRVRLSGLALVAAYVALHAQQGPARYMFVAPVLALGAWLLDAQCEWHVRALRALAKALRSNSTPRPAPLSLDTAPWQSGVSWRAVILRPARVAFFHPLTTIAAYIAVDAPRLDPDGVPSELFWYLAVTFAAFLTLVIVAASWWYDQFGDTAAPSPNASVVPSGYVPFPSSQGAAALPAPSPAPALAPGPAPAVSIDGPFPKVQRTEATNPFGTAVGDGASG